MPHSYNPDFLWNIDIYFPGMKDELTQVHFDKLFDSVLDSLKKERKRTFTHYEVKHFQSWYFRQTDEVQNSIKEIMAKGQLEFVTGGWDMHDEACPTYQDMLLNIQRGHQFLWEQFGYHPRTAWAMETSGHSAANPRVLSEAGIEAIFILNIEPEDRRLKL